MQTLIEEALAYACPFASRGRVADYIPELAKADPAQLGIAIATDGKLYEAGDSRIMFSMQSVAKVFSLIMALEKLGAEQLRRRVGFSPSERPFNALPQSDAVPVNPMHNAGCFVTLDCLGSVGFANWLARVRTLCGNPKLQPDEAVFRSECSASVQNSKILAALEAGGRLQSPAENILTLHARTSSVSVCAADLAHFACVLANDGCAPNGETLIDEEIAAFVRTVMFTCGMYEESGNCALRVGLPMKSGVGGAIIAAAPQMGIAVFGPALNVHGNSCAGLAALEFLSRRLGLSLMSRWRTRTQHKI